MENKFLLPVRDGGFAVIPTITWISPIRVVKVSKGKDANMITTEKWCFSLAVAGRTFESIDYLTEEECSAVHSEVISVIAGWYTR